MDDNNSNTDNIRIIIEPTNDEILGVIAKLKNRKSPGEDGITNEMLKYGGKALHMEICKFIKQIHCVHKLLEDFITLYFP